jgi:hypothetical protein
MSLAGAGASRHPSPFSIFISWHLLTGWAWGFADEPESVQFRVDHVSEEGSFRKTFTEVDSVLASTIADVAQEESSSSSSEDIRQAWPALEEDVFAVTDRAATMCQVRVLS